MSRTGSRSVKRAVALALRDPQHPGRTLIVRRPPDDAELPDVWGLPAASLRDAESWESAARRAALEKLGVEAEIGEEIARGTTERRHYTLDMRLFAGTIRSGVPHVQPPRGDTTQYTDTRWGTAADLEHAVHLGSLCCRLFSEHEHDSGPV
jgi:ADP-ribose pyrophosphatase YjhB (NUDIX family)